MATERPDNDGSYKFECHWDQSLVVEREGQAPLEFNPVDELLRGQPLVGTVDASGAVHLERLGPYMGPPDVLEAFEEIVSGFATPAGLPPKVVSGRPSSVTHRREVHLSPDLSVPVASRSDYTLAAIEGRNAVLTLRLRELGSTTVEDTVFAVDVVGSGELLYDRGRGVETLNSMSGSIKVTGTGPDGPFVFHGSVDGRTESQVSEHRFLIPGRRRR